MALDTKPVAAAVAFCLLGEFLGKEWQFKSLDWWFSIG